MSDKDWCQKGELASSWSDSKQHTNSNSKTKNHNIFVVVPYTRGLGESFKRYAAS